MDKVQQSPFCDHTLFLEFLNLILQFSRICVMIKIYGALRQGDGTVGISYDRLWKLMIERKLNKTELTNKAQISTNAMARLGKGEDVRLSVLEKLCMTLDCRLEDIIEIIPDDDKKK